MNNKQSNNAISAGPKKVGIISLGCAKALVDSERILTQLSAEGYEIADTSDGADVVIVNTCGFLDSARAESLEAIGEAMNQNTKVIVTGCLGIDEQTLREKHPGILAVTGPHAYEQVVSAVHSAVPPQHDPYLDLVPPGGIKLTPRHYAYLKISEGCNHNCRFCIIPQIRGPLKSRPMADIIGEAEKLASAGVKELLVISQDTSAYGTDLHGKPQIVELAKALGELGIWIRLHYVYPYPLVDGLVELMADGKILPYLDIPFQHASPSVLKSMRRPAHQEQTLARIGRWREICPDLAIRSTFIVGFPGETEADFEFMLDWLEQAELDRVGCFKYENVEGAPANLLDGHIDAEEIDQRWERFMEVQQAVSEKQLAAKVGRTTQVMVDAVGPDGVIARTMWDSAEVDGLVYLEGVQSVAPGDMLDVTITRADEHDLWAKPAS